MKRVLLELAQSVFDALLKANPAQGSLIQQVITELKQDYLAQAS